MHYLYTAFFESNQFGYPIIRPLWYEFPTDTNTFGISTQFMWGDSILVAPKLGAPAALSIAMNGIYNLSVIQRSAYVLVAHDNITSENR